MLGRSEARSLRSGVSERGDVAAGAGAAECLPVPAVERGPRRGRPVRARAARVRA
jgi:hypothetical protein